MINLYLCIIVTTVCLFVHTFANQIKTMGADNKATLEEIEAFLTEFKETSIRHKI